MKRIAILLCVLALLLAACSQPPAPETTRAPIPTDTAQTAASSAPPTEPVQTEPVATEPPVTEPPATESGYQAGGSPTAGGVVVYTDPSAYKPYSGPEAKYTRLHEGPLDHFEPSEDYGAVYPYAAARLFNALEDGQSWEAGARYGLVDAAGRLLTDGIYSNVKALMAYDYQREEASYRPFWLIETVERAEIITEGSDGETYTYIDGDTRYGVVSMDGSFALPMEYRNVGILRDGFLCTREWDGLSYEAYDGSGQFLFSGADLLGDDDFSGVTVVDGGEGLFLIELYAEERDTQCWFCDSRGQRVLGPYAEAGAFSEGLACVTLDGERYGYIDGTGAWILEPQFTSFGSFQDGRAIHRTEDNSTVIIDLAGNVLLTLDAHLWVYSSPCGFRVDNSDEWSTSYYDRDCNALFTGDYWTGNLDGDTFWEWDEEEGRIFRLDGSELKCAGVSSLSLGMTVLDGKAVEGYFGYGYSEEDSRGHFCFIPRDLSAIYPLDARGLPAPDADSTTVSAIDQCTGEKWYLTWNGKAWDAVNEAGEIRSLPLRTNNLILRGDRIMALTDRACVYTDWEGNILFSYPLDAQD